MPFLTFSFLPHILHLGSETEDCCFQCEVIICADNDEEVVRDLADARDTLDTPDTPETPDASDNSVETAGDSDLDPEVGLEDRLL